MRPRKIFTLVFLRKESSILLGFKKRGFGCNKWNGFGGKVEPNETILEGAVRELQEECCVTVRPEDLKHIGRLEFYFEGDPLIMDVRVFSTTVFEGTPRETEEMLPKWFNNDQIPFDDMWLDDQHWFPYMLRGKPFEGMFKYLGYDNILNYVIRTVPSLEDDLLDE